MGSAFLCSDTGPPKSMWDVATNHKNEKQNFSLATVNVATVIGT